MKDSFFNVLPKRREELFCCLEVTTHYYRAYLFSVSDNRLQPLRYWFSYRTDPTDLESLKIFIKGLNLSPKIKVILAGDNSLTVTVPAWVKVERSDGRREVDEGELENLISQAVWKFLNFYKSQALAALAISDPEILLANIRILNTRVNNHRVLNPTGFKAKTIDILIEETFINRDLYQTVVSTLSEAVEIVFITQLGVAESLVLLRSLGFDREFNVARLLPGAALFLKASSRPRYREGITDPIIQLRQSFDWDNENLTKVISGALPVDESVASDLLKSFIAGNASKKVLAFLKGMLDSEWQRFTKLANRNLNRSETIILSDYDLPAAFLRHPISLESRELSSLAFNFGFSLHPEDFNDLLPFRHFYSAAACFIEYAFSLKADHLNRMAERRAKWLIPSKM